LHRPFFRNVRPFASALCLAEINIERGFYKFIDTCVIEDLEDGATLYNSFDRFASIIGSSFKENTPLGLILTRLNEQVLCRFSIVNDRLQIGPLVEVLPQVHNNQPAANPADEDEDNLPFPAHFVFMQDRRQQVNLYLFLVFNIPITNSLYNSMFAGRSDARRKPKLPPKSQSSANFDNAYNCEQHLLRI
jgi:hypothetical protein